MNSREKGLGPAANHERTNSSVSNNSTLAISNDKEDPKSSECTSDDEDDFQDAVTDPEYVEFTVSGAPVHRRTISSVSTGSVDPEDGVMEGEEGTDYSSDQEDPNILTIVKRRATGQTNGKVNTSSNNSSPVRRLQGKQRRKRIPDKPDISFSLWSIMKNCIGKDLSKIPIPVNFSEPLSFLQRLNEDLEYSEVLDRASQTSDNYEQMALVAAFTVSSYRYGLNTLHQCHISHNPSYFSATAIRTGKPFNPLLHETFECDRREDHGWRCFAEQVLHHPPMVAQYCESDHGWNCWQEFTMRSKFKGGK